MYGRNSAFMVFVGLLIVMLFSVFAWVFLVPTKDISQRTIEQPIADKAPLKLRLISPTAVWKSRESYDVRVDLDKASEDHITAVNIELVYDPALISISEIKNGNLWTETKVLSLQVDDQSGKAFVSMVLAKDGKTTENRNIAIFEVTPKHTNLTKTTLSLGPRSILATPGSNNITDLESPTLSITLTI